MSALHVLRGIRVAKLAARVIWIGLISILAAWVFVIAIVWAAVMLFAFEDFLSRL